MTSRTQGKLAFRTAIPLLVAAHALAFSGGFGTGAVLAGGVAGWWPLGVWWAPVVQAHGTLQTLGWGALWVFAVGAVLMPKLCGVPARNPALLHAGAWLVYVALGLRLFAQALPLPGPVSSLAIAASGIGLFAGVTVIAGFLGASVRRAGPLRERPRLWKILPLLAPAFACLWLGAVLQAVYSLLAASAEEFLLDPNGHRAAGHLILMGFLLPAALGFGALLIPPFFRWGLIASRHLRRLACLLFPAVLAGAAGELLGSGALARAGGAALGVSILAYLGLLVWSATHPPPTLWPPGSAPSTRRLGFDRGEYGRFELLVLAAWLWLAVGGVVLLAGGPSDAARHAIGLGFVTTLIAAMAIRLVPTLLGGRVVWRWVAWPLLFGTGLAAAGRILPILVPGIPGQSLLFGLSGVAGLFVVALLGLHLLRAFAPTGEAAQRMRAEVTVGGPTASPDG